MTIQYYFRICVNQELLQSCHYKHILTHRYFSFISIAKVDLASHTYYCSIELTSDSVCTVTISQRFSLNQTAIRQYFVAQLPRKTNRINETQ